MFDSSRTFYPKRINIHALNQSSSSLSSMRLAWQLDLNINWLFLGSESVAQSFSSCSSSWSLKLIIFLATLLMKSLSFLVLGLHKSTVIEFLIIMFLNKLVYLMRLF